MHSTTVQGCTSECASEIEHKAREKGRNERDVGTVQFDNNAIAGSTNSTLRQRTKLRCKNENFYAPHQNE